MKFETKCNKCGECCRNPWRIILRYPEIKRIKNCGYAIESFVRIKNGIAEFKRRPDFSCVFLGKKNICSLHKKYGHKFKTEVCKTFPLDEFVCGDIIKKKTAKKKEVNGRQDFFIEINKKQVYFKTFLKLLLAIDSKKQLFDSYTDILWTVLNIKEKIILDILQKKDNKKDLRKLKKYIDNMLLMELSKNVFPRLDKMRGKKIEVKLPTEKDFCFEFTEAKIEPKVLKEFLPYLNRDFKRYILNVNYPLHLLLTTYYLPMFAQAVTKGKRMNIKHVLKALSILNGINRFGSSRLFEKYTFAKLDKKLYNLMLNN